MAHFFFTFHGSIACILSIKSYKNCILKKKKNILTPLACALYVYALFVILCIAFLFFILYIALKENAYVGITACWVLKES